jgi:hypothetical protein
MRFLLMLCASRAVLAGARHAAFAVCIVGECRTLRQDAVRENVQTMLLDSLIGGADVFAVLGGADDDCQSQLDALGVKRSMFLAINETSACAAHMFSDTPEALSSASLRLYFNFLSQQARFARCLRLVEERERVYGFTYDYVIRARPDIVYFAPASAWLRIDPEAVFTGRFFPTTPCSKTFIATDHFAVIPRRFAATYGNPQPDEACAFQTRDFLAVACHGCTSAAQECYLSHLLERHDIPWFGAL